MKKNLLKNVTVLILILLSTVGLKVSAQTPNLIWADEFNGNSLDLSKWQAQIGDGCPEGICGWGNGELQFYKAENAVVNNGMLSIVSKRERVQSKAYTSARIRTKNLGDFLYGRFEARIKLPAGAGLWPAFWMLSTDEPNGGWPMDGEIDIMEAISAKPDHVFGTIHYGNPYPNNQFQGNDFYLYDGSKFTDDFHVFAIEWEPGVIRWYVDDILYSVKTPEDIAPSSWPFDNNRFHLILNTAVGGTLGGTVDNTIFPATMLVDYVRVYDGPKPTISGKRVVSNNENQVNYQLDKLPSNVSVAWSVPAGASIASGQGSRQISVNFGDSSGKVIATFDPGSGSQSIPMDVVVEPSYTKGFTFQNFDDTGSATFSSSNGTHQVVSNPAPNPINNSVLCAEYIRNSQSQYDVIFYNTTAIPDASEYAGVGVNKKFYLDVYTNAPIGTEIILQLETSTATASNYPTGRHSRYKAKIKENGNWHRLEFSYFDRPDGSASNNIANMALLFNPNSLTGDRYYYDNLDSYNANEGGGDDPTNQPPVVSITNPSGGDSFEEGTNISIQASASDPEGSIVQVEFFVNGNSIGIDQSEPYTANWTVLLGTQSISAVATDNEGASTTSSAVTITGTTGGEDAAYLFVSEVVTGTINAGGGSRFGFATVTVRDNLNNPISGATVSGKFSGSFSESVSGTTGPDGKVTFQTGSTARGSVTVGFCVSNVNGILPYDASANSPSFTCTQTSSSGNQEMMMQSDDSSDLFSVMVYPNPVEDMLNLSISGQQGTLTYRIVDLNGKVHLTHRGDLTQLNVSHLGKGMYILECADDRQLIRIKFYK
jgi:beta-glucanase (GH16 family)